MISTNQLDLFSTVPTTVPNTVLYWFLGADGPRTKLLKLTESFSNNRDVHGFVTESFTIITETFSKFQ